MINKILTIFTMLCMTASITIHAQKAFKLPAEFKESDDKGILIEAVFEKYYAINERTGFYEDIADKSTLGFKDLKNPKCYFFADSDNSLFFYDDLAIGRLKFYNKKQIKQLQAYMKEYMYPMGAYITWQLLDRVKHDLYNRITDLNNNIRIQKKREKALADSLDNIRQAAIKDSITQAMREQNRDQYIKTHNWRVIPVTASYSNPLKCTLCQHTIYNRSDSVFAIAATTDTIYGLEKIYGDLGQSYLKIHKYPVTKELRLYGPFQDHLYYFNDSLLVPNKNDTTNFRSLILSDPEAFNLLGIQRYTKNLKTIAPNGYIKEFGWDAEYSMVTFNVKYCNTSKNTIKYIDFYFKILNDVNDVRLTGNFKGTGPVAEMETASWNWDSSRYFVAGDASTMRITKVVITYMNGTQKTLTGNTLKIN